MCTTIMSLCNLVSTTIRGIYSQNVTWVLILFGLIVIVTGNYLFPFNLGEIYKSTLDISTSTIFMCGTLIALWNAVFSVKQDLSSKTLWTILTKPVSRAEYLLGKALGVWTATISAYLIWTPVFLISAWTEYCYQKLNLTIGYNVLYVYVVTSVIVVGIGFGIEVAIRYSKREYSQVLSFLLGAKWVLAALAGAIACKLLVPTLIYNSNYPEASTALAATSLEWRILPTLLAMLQLHLLTILIGITAAMMSSLPMALLGTLVVGFAIEILPALWIPAWGTWAPLPVADGFRLNEPLTDVLSRQQPLGDYWFALASQSLPWLAFSGALLMLARYYLGQHDLADG